MKNSSYGRQSRRTASYSMGVGRAPSKPKLVSKRAIFSLILSILLPPVGIFMMWSMGIFKVRGRVMITVLGSVVLGFMLTFVMGHTSSTQLSPSPVSPQLRTPRPEVEVVTALGNIDQILSGETPEPTQVPEGAEPQPTTEADAQMAEMETILNTNVYSVNNGAKYYHSAQNCRGQQNNRTLTVREALSEGLAACSRCNPPSV